MYQGMYSNLILVFLFSSCTHGLKMRPLILLMSLLCLNQAAKIKQIKVNPEVFKGEYIHLQCLVEYEEEDSKSELSIEFYRSTDQDQLEHLSSNGELEIGNVTI